MRLALKVIFSVVGLILLTAQVSYKFYRLASMPVFRGAQRQYVSSGYRPVSPMDEDARLSLDKRFDLKSSFALLTPVFRFLHFAGPGLVLPCLSAPEPVDHGHVLTFLRGPPAGAGFS
jgi:hypothetical protein